MQVEQIRDAYTNQISRLKDYRQARIDNVTSHLDNIRDNYNQQVSFKGSIKLFKPYFFSCLVSGNMVHVMVNNYLKVMSVNLIVFEHLVFNND